MPLLLHGIIPHHPDFERFDEDIELIHAYETTVIASVVADERVRASRRNLLRHEHILEHALERAGVVLPVRFGTVIDDTADFLHSVLSPQASHIYDLFMRLHGLHEMHVRITWDEQFLYRWARNALVKKQILPEEAVDSPDTLESLSLSDRIALGRSVEAEIRSFHEVQAMFISFRKGEDAVAVQELPVSDILTSMAVAMLVSQEQQAAIEKKLADYEKSDDLSRVHQYMTIRIITPLPPYSFVQWTV